MDFNFDEIVNRKGTHSIKWDAAPFEDVLPLWVADMDFKTAPVIAEALRERVQHGVFGYTGSPPEFYKAIINWWKKRHGFTLQNHWIIPTAGVIPALSVIIRVFAAKGDKVILQSPVYNHFYTTLKNCGCGILENKLQYSGGEYRIDFDDLERKAAAPDVKLLLISNPHNPIGRVWTAAELRRIGDICLQHNVVVISDEIHSDLVYNGFTHVPFASLGLAYSNNSITLSSPSKSFNLAGLQVGYLFTENSGFKKKLQELFTLQEMELLSPFAITALIAAYDDGEVWLETLKDYLHDNYNYLKAFIETHLPQLQLLPLQATYLVWVDCSVLGISSDTLAATLLNKQKVWVNSGTLYGGSGEGFLRINIACPRTLLAEGLNRIKEAMS